VKKSSSSDEYSSSSFRFGDDDVDDASVVVKNLLLLLCKSCRFFIFVTFSADGEVESSPRLLVGAVVLSTEVFVVANIYKVNVYIKCDVCVF